MRARSKIMAAVKDAIQLIPEFSQVTKFNVSNFYDLPSANVIHAGDDLSDGAMIMASNDDLQNIELVVEIRCKGIGSAATDQADGLAALVEAALVQDATIKALVIDLVEVETIFETDGSADQATTICRLQFDAQYIEQAPAPGFVAPTVDSWSGAGLELTASSIEVIFDSCTTAGDACTVQWILIADRISIIMPVTSPEQNSPHRSTLITSNPEHFGETFDLYWRWWSGEYAGVMQLVQADAVDIPTPGTPGG